MKVGRGDLLADPHKILNRWKNYFCHLLNMHGEVGVRQTEMHTAEPGRVKLNGTKHLLVYADVVDTVGENVDTTKKNTEALLDGSK
jgi:hypothetical protein